MSHLFILKAVFFLHLQPVFILYTKIACNVLAMKCVHFANGLCAFYFTAYRAYCTDWINISTCLRISFDIFTSLN